MVILAPVVVLALAWSVMPGYCAQQLYEGHAAHPRLLCSAAELAEARSRLDGEIEAAALKRLLLKCDTYLDPESEWYVDWRERQKWFWASRHGAWLLTKRFQELAWAGVLSGEQRYIDGAKNIVLTIVRERVIDNVGGESHGKQYKGWKSNMIDASSSGAPLGIFYDLLYDYMTEQERAEVRNYIIDEYLLFLYDYQLGLATNDRYPAILGTNSYLSGHYAGLVLTLAVYGETGRSAREEIGWLKTFMTGIRGYLLLGIGDDGGMLEGPGYGAYCLNMIGCAAEMLKRAGAEKLGEDPPLWKHPRLRRAARYFLHQVRPNGDHYNNISDSSFAGQSTFLLLYASRLDAPVLSWLWQHVDGRPNDETIFGDHNDKVWEPVLPYVILWHGQAPGAKSPDELGIPRDRLFSRRGLVSMRTNWRDDGCLFSFLCGGQPDDIWSHKQYDANHFALYCGDSVLAYDPGYGGRETAVHNSLLFDGKGQVGRCIEGRIVAFKPGDIASYACGRAGDLYDNEALSKFDRHVYFVRGPHGPAVAIWDDVAADGKEHTYTWLLNIVEGMEFDVSGDHPVVVDAANAWLMDVFLFASVKPEMTLETAQHSVHWSSGVSTYKHPRLLADVKTDRAPGFLALLYPHKLSVEAPEVTRVNDRALRVAWQDCVDLIAFGPARTAEGNVQDTGFVRSQSDAQ